MQENQHQDFWALAKQEFARKFIHMASVLTIFVARYSEPLLILLLSSLTLIYILAESLRLVRKGGSIIAAVVALTKRGNEANRPALGPITLALGIMSAFLLYPPAAARIAVAAVAFGDGMASLIGRLFGKVRPKFLLGKSIEGSLSCFAVVLMSTLVLSKGHLLVSVVIALIVSLVEALPLGSLDNIIIPLIAGFISYQFGF